jgi:hypothetical protein
LGVLRRAARNRRTQQMGGIITLRRGDPVTGRANPVLVHR